MALTIGFYWLIPLQWRFRFLIGVTLLFLVVNDYESAILLCVLTFWAFLFSRIENFNGTHCIVASSVIIAILSWYKISIVKDLNQGAMLEAAIPLGLSYYSFRLLHFLIERYKGTVSSAGLEEFCAYMFFLPTIVVGPIHRWAQFQKDLFRSRWDAGLFSEGLERLVYGYFKITVLGNYLLNTRFGQFVGDLPSENTSTIFYLEVVRNGLNLYVQFSGFSDIAIGFARLLGFRVMENFAWPYLQPNISRYWRCWHMSLTSWCRDYVYTTVVSISRSPALGAVATLIVIGLWHEASLRFIAWGCYHGLGIITWQKWQHIKQSLPTLENVFLARGLHVLSVLFTVHFVWFGLVIVTQPDFGAVLHVWKTILLFWL